MNGKQTNTRKLLLISIGHNTISFSPINEDLLAIREILKLPILFRKLLT